MSDRNYKQEEEKILTHMKSQGCTVLGSIEVLADYVSSWDSDSSLEGHEKAIADGWDPECTMYAALVHVREWLSRTSDEDMPV